MYYSESRSSDHTKFDVLHLHRSIAVNCRQRNQLHGAMSFIYGDLYGSYYSRIKMKRFSLFMIHPIPSPFYCGSILRHFEKKNIRFLLIISYFFKFHSINLLLRIYEKQNKRYFEFIKLDSREFGKQVRQQRNQ